MADDDLFIVVKTEDGVAHRLPALAGWSVMEIIRDAGLPGLKAECGGALSCATCHVYVDPSWGARLTPARDDERDMIDDHVVDPKENSRLSCQIIMRDDLNGIVVTIGSNPD